MSKKQKLLDSLRQVPAPIDYRWDDLVTVMKQAGFVVECEGGSHHMFEHTSGYRFSMSRTHPSGLLKRYQVKSAIEALAAVGAIEERNDG